MKGDKQRSISIKAYWNDKKRSKKHREINRKIMKITSLKNKGRKHSKKTIKKMSLCKLGNKNPVWKEDEVKYTALHNWIRRHKLKPELCEDCHKNKPYDLANISGNYKRDINDFEWICRRCHMIKDGRKDRLIQRLIIQNKDEKFIKRNRKKKNK